MLAYDKIIIDTSNIFYRVASFYLKDLDQSKVNQLLKSNIILSTYKSFILNMKQSTLGKVILLFDPLSSEKKGNSRSQIDENYKENRKNLKVQDILKYEILSRLYKLFVTENYGVDIYHDLEYEADDFAEKLTKKGKCLLITSDKDFSRYLEEGRIDMLTQGLTIKDDSIFTANNFKEKYGFIPNISSVTLWKVCYGDTSDNISGAFTSKSTKVLRQASEEMQKILVYEGEQNRDLTIVKKELFQGLGVYKQLNYLLSLSNTDCSLKKLFDMIDNNLQLIESKLPRNSDIDINKFLVKPLFNSEKVIKKSFTLNSRKF